MKTIIEQAENSKVRILSLASYIITNNMAFMPAFWYFAIAPVFKHRENGSGAIRPI
ncbi:hypothetical protein [Methanooceanicella nereidis]|uniref:hypothetical protein n=1 Tax=Methanooceanicella nereidis TaxID=2052831 RepID=UPI001E440A79|nr:hypothetical protein [Methanocella sp. CWC-04]